MIFGWYELPNMCVQSMPRSRGWSYAKADVIEGKERAQFVAEDGASTTMTLFLHARYCKPQEVLDALIAMADAHEAHVVQTDDGRIVGQYIIEKVDDTPIWTLPDGTLMAANVVVALSDPGLDTPLARTQAQPQATGDSDEYEYYELDEPDMSLEYIDLDADPAEVPTSEIVRS